MGKTWTIAAVVAAWLGVNAAQAQPLPMAPDLPPGMAPGMGGGMPPPGYPGPAYAPGPYAPNGSVPGMMPVVPPQVLAPMPPSAQMPGVPGGQLTPGMLPGAPPFESLGPRPLVGWKFNLEPFVMWYSPARFPALITTGDVFNDPIPGALGQPGTVILNGGTPQGGDPVMGLRMTLTMPVLCFDDTVTADVGGFMTERRDRTYSVASNANGTPLITRPYFNPNFGNQDADIRSFPGSVTGYAQDQFRTQLYGAEGNLRWMFAPLDPQKNFSCGFGALVGARYLQLDESYQNYDAAIELPVGATNSFLFHDNFGTRNHIVAAQIGAIIKAKWCNVTYELVPKIIAGYNQQQSNISGYTQFTDNAGVTTTDFGQGFYVMPSNAGNYHRTVFNWGSSIDMNFGFRITNNFNVKVGYSFMTFNRIVRPGDQIDSTINIQPLFSGGGFGVARPQQVWHETMLQTHALSLGFEWLY